MDEWQIGDVRIRCLVEGAIPVPADLLVPAATPGALAPHLAWACPDYVNESGHLLLAFQAMLVESAGVKIVVDTCMGNDRVLPNGLPRIHTDFLERLAAAGFGPDDVNVVLCTHLHFDHVGWNTMLVDGAWVPTFPHATYLFGQTEYEFWQDHDDANTDLTDSVEPIVAAGLHKFVASDHVVTPEVRLVPTPGHTPGHASVLIESRGERALITGGIAHHPVQLVEHHWSSLADRDADAAVAMRSKVAGQAADDGTLLIGTHFAAPAAGWVRRSGTSWSWEAKR